MVEVGDTEPATPRIPAFTSDESQTEGHEPVGSPSPVTEPDHFTEVGDDPTDLLWSFVSIMGY